ncbi:MAG: hypothetical protein PHO10_06420 [Gemmiger sp.]|nr:hypothetical protein [Gemmiger sp.]
MFAATLALLFALLLGAYALPGAPVRGNIQRSVPLLQQEGLYPEFFGFKLFQMDNYTDTIMLFEAATADEAAPLAAMMANTAYNVDNFETLPDDLARYLAQGQGAGLTPFSYARYWHGYLIYLRPLLLVFTYGQVRVISYLLGAALLGALLWRLATVCGRRAAWWFGVSQLLVSCFFVPRQLQFFSCFAIAYLACLWVLAKPRTATTLALGLVAVGAATAFIDLLVTPILTLGLPVTVWLLCPAGAAANTLGHGQMAPKNHRQGLAGCGTVVGGSVAWGAGYGCCWAAKWVLAGAITGNDVLGDALHQASVRTAADTWRGMALTWGNIFRFIYDTLAARGLFWPLVAVVLGCVALFVLCLRGRAQLVAALPLALTACMAPVWFAALRTHSIQHGWFTWRALCVTLFAGAAFLWQACSLQQGLHRLKPKKQK